MRLFIVAFVLIALIALAACGGGNAAASCYEDSTEFIAAVDDLSARWEDTTAVAETMSRLTLPAFIPEMQALQRETEALTPPECTEAQAVHTALNEMMDAWIGGFLAFASGQDMGTILGPLFTTTRSDYQVAYANLTRPGLEPVESDEPCDQRAAAFVAQIEELRADVEEGVDDLIGAPPDNWTVPIIFLNGARTDAAEMPALSGCQEAEAAEALRTAFLDYAKMRREYALGLELDNPDLVDALDAAQAALAPVE